MDHNIDVSNLVDLGSILIHSHEVYLMSRSDIVEARCGVQA